MSEITIWSCGDLDTALEINNLIRVMGYKARVYDSKKQEGTLPWKHGQHIIVGDGMECPHLTSTSSVLFFGDACNKTFHHLGGGIRTLPPGLTRNVRQILWINSAETLGHKNSNFAIETNNNNFIYTQLPSGWLAEAKEENGGYTVVSYGKNYMCGFTPVGKSLTNFLFRIFDVWKCKESNATEKAFKKAITAAQQQNCSNSPVVVGFSGGLFSTVTLYVLEKAIGRDRVIPCFVKTGLEKYNMFSKRCGGVEGLEVVDVRCEVLKALNGIDCVKRRRGVLNKIFVNACKCVCRGAHLAQGATYESIIRGIGRKAVDIPGVLQPLEGLSVGEVELIASQAKLVTFTDERSAAGYSDLIIGPFSEMALELCTRIDWICDKYSDHINKNTKVDVNNPRKYIKIRYKLDTWETNPRVLLTFLTSKDYKNWKVDDRDSLIYLLEFKDELVDQTRSYCNHLEVMMDLTEL